MLILLLLLLGFLSFGAISLAELPHDGVAPDIATMECQLAGGMCPAPIASSHTATCCPIDVRLSGDGSSLSAGGAAGLSPESLNSETSGLASECTELAVPAGGLEELTLALDAFGCARWSLPAVAEAEGVDVDSVEAGVAEPEVAHADGHEPALSDNQL